MASGVCLVDDWNRETVSECCAREALEETGLVVDVGGLVGVYSSPSYITEYVDGNRKQGVDLIFYTQIIGGGLRITEETIGVGYFTKEEMQSIEIVPPVEERISDAFLFKNATLIR